MSKTITISKDIILKLKAENVKLLERISRLEKRLEK